MILNNKSQYKEKVSVTSYGVKISILIAILFLIFSPQATSADITTGLVGHWKMDDNTASAVVTDDGSGGNNATMKGTNPNTSDRTVAGNISTALDFNGSDNYGDLGDITDFELTVPFSMAAWVNIDELPAVAPTILSKYASAGAYREWFWVIHSADNKQRFFKSSTGSGGYETLIANTAFVSDDVGSWIHLALTVDSDGNWEFYHNGTSDGTGTFTSTTIFAGPAKAHIGAVDSSSSSPDLFFNGALDDVRLYTRELSTDDITELYTYTGVAETTTPTDTSSPHHTAGVPPTVTEVKTTSITDTTAVVTWTTDKEAHGEVYYGTDLSPTDVKADWTPMKDHSIELSNLQPQTTYHYSVRSKDIANNSALTYSDRFSFTTLGTPDIEPPSTPKYLRSRSISPSIIDLSWSESVDNNNGVIYSILRNDILIATIVNNSFRDDSLQPNTEYKYTITAIDASDNESSQVTVTEKTRRNGSKTYSTTSFDDTPPETPRNLRAVVVSDSRVDLKWSKSEDDVKVWGYNVFRGGVLVDNVIKSKYKDRDLSPNTTYTYSVSAFDVSDNESNKSFKAEATTLLKEESNYCSALQKRSSIKNDSLSYGGILLSKIRNITVTALSLCWNK
jgi:hypothetical protein